jgi:hypothetical protein
MKANSSFPGLFLMSALILGCSAILPTASRAQEVISAPYEVTPMPRPLRKMQGELACPYFMWNNYTGSSRAVFRYITAPGNAASRQEESTRFENLSVVITSNDVPTARMLGEDDYGHMNWQLAMSQRTYDENKACLPKAATPAAPPAPAAPAK